MPVIELNRLWFHFELKFWLIYLFIKCHCVISNTYLIKYFSMKNCTNGFPRQKWPFTHFRELQNTSTCWEPLLAKRCYTFWLRKNNLTSSPIFCLRQGNTRKRLYATNISSKRKGFLKWKFIRNKNKRIQIILIFFLILYNLYSFYNLPESTLELFRFWKVLL